METHHLGVPTSEYSLHVPFIPSIPVPPSTDHRQFILPPYAGLPLLTNSTPPHNDTILRHLLTCSVAPNVIRYWEYKMRRQAQRILPFLYLGPSVAARDIEALKGEGITMLLVIRNTMTAQARILSGDKVAAQLGIQAKSVDVAGHQELIAAFPKAIQIINEHLISTFREGDSVENWDEEAYPNYPFSSGKILVFCESGNERSATVVVAYLMAMYDMDIVSAVQCIQSLRFCVGIDEELKNLLLNWQEIVEAQRDIAMQRGLQPGMGIGSGGLVAAKRGRGEVQDDDMDLEMAGCDDRERFVDRDFKVPFDGEALVVEAAWRSSSADSEE